jgi:predicted membrane protein
MGSGNIEPLDLEDIRLAKLVLQQSYGNAEIVLPGQGVMDVDIQNGFGNVEVEIPEDLAVRIEVESSVGNVEVDERFQLEDGAYVTANYDDDAPNRATIRITKTVGNIEIR